MLISLDPPALVASWRSARDTDSIGGLRAQQAEVCNQENLRQQVFAIERSVMQRDITYTSSEHACCLRYVANQPADEAFTTVHRIARRRG